MLPGGGGSANMWSMSARDSSSSSSALSRSSVPSSLISWGQTRADSGPRDFNSLTLSSGVNGSNNSNNKVPPNIDLSVIDNPFLLQQQQAIVGNNYNQPQAMLSPSALLPTGDMLSPGWTMGGSGSRTPGAE